MFHWFDHLHPDFPWKELTTGAGSQLQGKYSREICSLGWLGIFWKYRWFEGQFGAFGEFCWEAWSHAAQVWQIRSMWTPNSLLGSLLKPFPCCRETQLGQFNRDWPKSMMLYVNGGRWRSNCERKKVKMFVRVPGVESIAISRLWLVDSRLRLVLALKNVTWNPAVRDSTCFTDGDLLQLDLQKPEGLPRYHSRRVRDLRVSPGQVQERVTYAPCM